MPSMEAPPVAPSEPEPQVPEPAPQPAVATERLNPYLRHQADLMLEAFAREHPSLATDLESPGKKDAIGLWWVGKGYAAAFAHAAKMLRETGEDRLPNLADLELDSEDEDREALSLAEKRFGQSLG